MNVAVETAAELRVLRFLRHGFATCRAASMAGMVLLERDAAGSISVEETMLSALIARKLVVRDGARVSLSHADLAERQANRGKPLGGRDFEIISVAVEAEPSLAIVNLAESPLAQLARRKNKDGKPFLTHAEVGAGERLRTDYTRGQIMPRLGANWVAAVSAGRRSSGGPGGAVELTEAALAARQRVDKAIAAVGPELSGVLIDICCFLKGLELVETERGWPVRSAKVVLKSALGVLSRHYNPAPSSAGRKSFFWGAPDYRPEIGVKPSA